jgi:hypothetical protein
MLTFDNQAEMISGKIMTYTSSFESTQFFDYAMKLPNRPLHGLLCKTKAEGSLFAASHP